jgi:hypothetical protein
MALDLKPKLRTQLSDEDAADYVWTDTELDAILGYALDETNRVRPRVVSDVIALTANDDTYVLTNVYEVFRVDLLDSNDKLIMPMPHGTWEVWGDNQTAGQTLYINPRYTFQDYSIRVHGYGPYDFTTNTPPTQVQQAILALSRAEAYRRVTGERARYEQYSTANPRGDTSMSELLGLTNEADSEAQRLLSNIRLIKKPTVGRM